MPKTLTRPLSRIAPLTLLAVLLLLTLLVFVLPTPDSEQTNSLNAGEADAATGRVLLRNVRLIGTEGASEPGALLLEAGTITQLGDETTLTETLEGEFSTIDGAGAFVVPGLIDSHTHSYGTSLADSLRFGVTTQLDMFTDPTVLDDTRAQRESSEPTQQSDLWSAGMLATAPGGHGTQFGVSVDPLTSPGDAQAWVAARKAEGSDYIKLAYIPGGSIPSLDRATARAVITAAHDQGLMALAHVSRQQAALDMVHDGIDGLVHIFADEPVSDEFLQAAQEGDLFIIPTLAVIESVAGKSPAAEEGVQALLSPMQKQSLASSFGTAGDDFQLDLALGNVRRLHEAGIAVLAGSDAPNPGTAQGLSQHRELELLVMAGLTPIEALAAATRQPAKHFSLSDRGRVAPGFRADLLLLADNPMNDISATRSIQQVIKNGAVVSRSQVAEPQAAQALDRDLLGNFETGLDAPGGFVWTTTDDGMADGKSEVAISRAPGGAEGSAHALQIDATVRRGFPFPWAGAALMSSAGADIRAYSKIRFDVRGTAGSYRLMGFNLNAMGIPPTVNFTVTSEWTTHTVALAELTSLLPESVMGFAWVAGPEPGESTVYLDNVRLEP